MLHLVIMAGGSGTRFWPASRRDRPKQLLSLAGNRTLLQQAAHRCRPLIGPAATHVVTGAACTLETRTQLPDLAFDQILVEPSPRNTAPGIGLAALHVQRLDPLGLMLVTPADHVIGPEEAFRATVEQGVQLLERHPQASVLLGVPPTFPATGYGYISRGAQVSLPAGEAFQVDAFREKPTLDVAERYLREGGWFWNCGIFLWRAAEVLRLLREFQPEMHERLMRLDAAWGTPRWDAALTEEFPRMPSVSIDYGVLEPLAARPTGSRELFVVPAQFDWDDVGSWESLPRLLGSDRDGNTLVGPHAGLETRDCVIRTTDDHLVATIGLANLLVVHTPEATLIAPRNDGDAIRRLVALLEEQGYGRYL